jgi:quercetin dioxygenase-like cupin family protein
MKGCPKCAAKKAAQKGLLAKPAPLKKMIGYQKGSVVSQELVAKKTGTVTLFAFDAGQGLSPHSAPYDALVQLVDGKAEITIGGKKNLVKTGEAILMPSGVPHAVKAVGRFMMLLTMIKSK